MPLDNEDVISQSSGEAEDHLDVADGAEAQAGEADSSPAEDVTEDTQSIIKDVVGRDAKEGSSPDSGEETVPEDGSQADEGDEEDDYKDLPFGKHPRFQEVLGKVKTAEAKAERFEADATRYQNVERFLADNAMNAEEAANMLSLAALAKTDPVRAWETIKPWVRDLATAAGVIVSPALQQRVQTGEINMATARELAAAEARAASATTQSQANAARIEQQQAETARQAIREEVTGWESQRKLRDPNFDAKYDVLQWEVKALQAKEGKPANAKGVRDQLDRAYKAVNAAFRPPTPPPSNNPAPKRAVTPVTGGQSAGNASAEPSKTVDIIRNRMARG